MCNLHVIFLSKITPRYFTWFTNGMFRPFSVRRELGSLRWWNLSLVLRWTLYRTPVGSLENAVLCCALFTKPYHSNEHLQISTVEDRLSMFATCGRIAWEAPTHESHHFLQENGNALLKNWRKPLSSLSLSRNRSKLSSCWKLCNFLEPKSVEKWTNNNGYVNLASNRT
jgi:hypothetical protein